jgi:hypothetical protein
MPETVARVTVAVQRIAVLETPAGPFTANAAELRDLALLFLATADELSSSRT